MTDVGRIENERGVFALAMARGKTWGSEEHARFVHAWSTAPSLKEAAAQFPDRTYAALERRGVEFGIKRCEKRVWTEAEISTLRAVWGTSTPITDIAQLFEGRGIGAIRTFASSLGLKRVAKVPRPTRQKYKIEVRDGVEGKKCAHCDWRPLTKFSRSKETATGRANVCTTCHGRIASKKYPEKLRENVLRYQWKDRPAFLLKAKVISHRRRARIRACETDVTEQALRDLFTVYEHTCAYCFERATTIDHVVAISRGGLHKLNNLVPACMDCNRRKHAKSVEEFITEKQL